MEKPEESVRPLPPLPTFDGGCSLVDIADREALYQAMEGRWPLPPSPTSWGGPRG